MSHKARRPGRQEIVTTTPTSGQTNTQALLGTKYEICRFPGMFKSPQNPKYPEYSGANRPIHVDDSTWLSLFAPHCRYNRGKVGFCHNMSFPHMGVSIGESLSIFRF